VLERSLETARSADRLAGTVSPSFDCRSDQPGGFPLRPLIETVVGLGRFELPTSPLSGVRSNQLSYRPKVESQPATPPPALEKTTQPGARRLSQSSFSSKGFRGQRLNMLSGYAAHDHRANFDQAKKACIRIPAPAVRDGSCGLDGRLHSTPCRFTSEALRLRGRNTSATISLLERR
jgi:hypothetical protein